MPTNKTTISLADIKSLPVPLSSRFCDLTGKQFGRLLVLGFGGYKNKHTIWVCQCICGKLRLVPSNHLGNGHTRSCGCLSVETVSKRRARHRASRSVEYDAYSKAKSRCERPTIANYAYYGGRGIEFRFKSYEDFFAEVGKRPTPLHSLDRINVNGHYEKGNVRWATPKQQQNNKQDNHLLTIHGITKTLTEWADATNLKSHSLRRRALAGWCNDCLLKPVPTTRCSHH